MKSAFIFHGSNGSKDAHWYPWLKVELKKTGLRVFLPQFPIEEKQLEREKSVRNFFRGPGIIDFSLLAL